MDAIFYTSELEYQPGDIQPFVDWFSGRHSADLFRAGFYTTTCYRAVEGGLTIVDMYQAETWNVFTGEGYKVRDKDPYAKQKLAPRTNNVNTVYSYHPFTAGDDPLRKIDSDWVALIRFDADPDTIAQWLGTTEAARLRGLGATSIRLVRRTKDRPGTTSYRPNCAILTEWPTRPPSTNILTDHLSRTEDFIGYRLYPWPDDTELLHNPPTP
jgi:hypothetical protein